MNNTPTDMPTDTNNHNHIDCYQQLLALTQSMLTMSENNEWNTLEELDIERQSLFSTITHDKNKADHKALLETVVALNQRISANAQTHQQDNKETLIKLKKGIKLNAYYQQ